MMTTSTVLLAAACGAAVEWCGTQLTRGGSRAAWRLRRSRAAHRTTPRSSSQSASIAEGAD
jgi:hypothetical protein